MALSKIKGTVIADDAINADRIADGTVVASDLLDNTLTGAKLATDIAITTSGNITTTGAFTSTGIDDNATSTAITIDSSENVGIGESSPSVPLHVTSAENTLARFESTDANANIRFADGNSTGFPVGIGATGTFGNEMTLISGGSDVVRIDSSGNVGIGTSSPSADLHISGSGSTLQLTDEANSHSYQWQAANDRFEIRDVTNAVERFTLLPSGNIGIGTTAPSEILDVRGSATMLQYDTGSGTGPAIQQYHNSVSPADNDIIGRIRFFGNDSGGTKTSFAEIKALSTDVTDTSEDGALTFFTINSGSLSERMRITNAGNVGIGTSSPNEKIHAESSVTTKVKSKTTTSTAIGGFEAWGNSTSYLKMYQFGSSYGGTTFGGVTGNNQAVIEAQEVSSLAFTTQGGTPDIIFAPARTARMTIKNGGNVGIGTSSPATILELASTTNNNVITFDPSNGGSNDDILGGLDIQNDGSVGRLTVRRESSTTSGYMKFETRSTGGALTERMRINGSGNVGIGTSSPTEELHIENSVNPTLLIKNPTNGNDANLNINKAGSSSRGLVRFQTTGGTTWHVGSTRFTTTGFAISTNDDFNSSSEFRLTTSGLTLAGSLSKGSGSFKIDHPLPEKTNTHHLVHSFVESPQANNIYRGKVDLVSGTATVNVDTVSGMTEGTFVLLNRDIQCFTSNETGWTSVKGSVSGNTLTITAQDNTCTDTISWMVIGERQDQHMYDTDWTDDNGKVIVEPLKETEE